MTDIEAEEVAATFAAFSVYVCRELGADPGKMFERFQRLTPAQAAEHYRWVNERLDQIDG